MSAAAGVAAPRDAYFPKSLTAFGPGCRAALAQGLLPCVVALDLGKSSSSPRESCWWRQPAKTPRRAKNANQLRGLGLSTRDSIMLSAIVSGQTLGKRRTALDAIRLDDLGRVWARATDAKTTLHPVVLGRAPEKRSPLAEWDLLAEDGRLLGTLQVSSRIDIVLIRGASIIGLRETDDGDMEIVRVELPLLEHQ